MSDALTKLRYPKLGSTTIDEIPVGFYMPWEKSMQSSIPPWWVESNGQLLDDIESILNGQYIPNLNNVVKAKFITLTSGSTTVTMNTTRDIVAGALVQNSTYLTIGTKILSIDSETEVTIDQPALGTITDAPSNIGGNGPVFLAGGSVSGLWVPDQMQGHAHNISLTADPTGSGILESTTSANGGFGKLVESSATSNSQFDVAVPKDDGTNGTPRTGSESFPKHHTVTYVMKVKTSNQTKLVTGFSLQGEEFGTLAEAGTNIKATDRLAVYDPVGGIYKNVFVSRALSQGVQDISGNATLVAGSPRINNVSTGAIDATITLPEGSTLIAGDEFEVHKVDSGTGKIVVARSGTDVIDGVTSIDIDSQYDYARLRWSGAYWSLVEYKDHGGDTSGYWTRYANGDMKQHGRFTIPASTNTGTITYPISFYVKPSITWTIDALTNELEPAGVNNQTVSSFAWGTFNPVSASSRPDAVWKAEGRWRA